MNKYYKAYINKNYQNLHRYIFLETSYNHPRGELRKMEYYLYRQSRDTAWEILLRTNARQLPVKLNDICKLLEIRLCSYDTGQEILEKLGLLQITEQTDGFTYHETGGHIIFFDTSQPVSRQRFTIAHELGHIVLGHVARGYYTVYNYEPRKSDAPHEQAANAFAARLLAPACVLHFARISTASQIAQACQISMQAAQYRAERLALLETRNEDFIKKFGKGCFFRSALEEAVYNQFLDYIHATNHNLPGANF